MIVLTDEEIDQVKFKRTFGQKLYVDGEIVFPFRFFRRGDPHNIYTNAISSLILKSKCRITIDTFTCALLPGIDVTYVHYPLFKQSELIGHSMSSGAIPHLKTALYYLLYNQYQKKTKNKENRVILANSGFTSKAIREELDRDSFILYPPVSSFFLQTLASKVILQKKDQVVTISRLAPEKNLERIPMIAKLTQRAKFIIIGNRQNQEVQSKIAELIRYMNVDNKVKILVDAPKEQLRKILLNSKVYLHTAINEHFGISIIEAMACGCIPIVHDSGGPREFIPPHLRYTNPQEAAVKIEQAILDWSPKIAQRMREIASRFSEDAFSEKLLSTLAYVGLLPTE